MGWHFILFGVQDAIRNQYLKGEFNWLMAGVGQNKGKSIAQSKS